MTGDVAKVVLRGCRGMASTGRWLVTGTNPGKSHGQGRWVSHERHGLDDGASAKRKARSCSILLMGEMRLQWMPRLERSRLGLQMILVVLRVTPPSPYILG